MTFFGKTDNENDWRILVLISNFGPFSEVSPKKLGNAGVGATSCLSSKTWDFI